MQKQKQIKNRKRNRLQGYDYSRDGWYFITICVKNRIECLGKIKNEKMEYSQYGDAVLKFWKEIPDHYENAFLDQWVIMPNHIHGVIVIENSIDAMNVQNSQKIKQCLIPAVGTEHCSVPTANNHKNYGLLSKIVKSFKEISLKTIRKNYNDYEFSWQRSFYDHIIRNKKSLENIRRYIYYNPVKWELDRNNLENLWI